MLEQKLSGALLIVALAAALRAEDGILVLHASNTTGKPVAGVSLGTLGDGSTGPPTDRSGKTRIRLAPQTRPGTWVSLQVVSAPKDLVFISPWDGRVRVPPFDNEAENFAPVVLVERGDRRLLEGGQALASLAAKVNTAVAPRRSSPPVDSAEPKQKAALDQVAETYGVNRDELDRALRSLAQRSKDPYERGMSALYQRKYDDASEQLSRALDQRERLLRPVASNVVNAARFLGQALYEQGKFADAADAYRKALKLRPDDPVLLSGLGLSLLKAGRPEAAEDYLRRAVELEQRQ